MIWISIGKWKYYYIPLIICMTYILIFYFWLSTFDWITNMLISSSLVIPIGSISLLLRVKKMKRRIDWKWTRKMTLKSMIILILYFALISFIRIYFFPNLIDEITYYYLYLYRINYTTYDLIKIHKKNHLLKHFFK